jgi:hypothetical protein
MGSEAGGMKLLLGIATTAATVIWALHRLWATLEDLRSLGDIIADCRRSRKVAVLWLLCLASMGLGCGLLAASQRAWWIALAFVVAVVTFIQANQLTNPLTPSPFEVLVSFLRECLRTPRRVILIATILLLDGAAVYLLWRRFPPQWAMACFFAGGLAFVAGTLLSWRSWWKEERRRLARVRSVAERDPETNKDGTW